MAKSYEAVRKEIFSTVQKRVSTKQHIANVAEVLMESIPLEALSVRNIIEAAGVSKTTFYRHFKDKQDVVLWIYSSKIEELVKDLTTFEEVTLACYTFLHSRRTFFTRVMTYDEQNNLSDFIFNLSYADIIKTVKAYENSDEVPSRIMKSIKFFCSGIQGLWKEWCSTGMKEGPEEITAVVLDNIPDLLKPYLRVYDITTIR